MTATTNDQPQSDDERVDFVEVDLSTATSPLEIQEILADALQFPGFYGNNWNAFWDAITGLVPMPRRLRIRGWTELESRFPNDAELLRGCLDGMAIKYPSYAAIVTYG